MLLDRFDLSTSMSLLHITNVFLDVFLTFDVFSSTSGDVFVVNNRLVESSRFYCRDI